jgi:toxin YoeB
MSKLASYATDLATQRLEGLPLLAGNRPQRVTEVIRDALRNPFSGVGKPEPLKNNLKGWWSRRITQEHRLIYRVEGDSLIIMQCRFHYDS